MADETPYKVAIKKIAQMSRYERLMLRKLRKRLDNAPNVTSHDKPDYRAGFTNTFPQYVFYVTGHLPPRYTVAYCVHHGTKYMAHPFYVPSCKGRDVLFLQDGSLSTNVDNYLYTNPNLFISDVFKEGHSLLQGKENYAAFEKDPDKYLEEARKTTAATVASLWEAQDYEVLVELSAHASVAVGDLDDDNDDPYPSRGGSRRSGGGGGGGRGRRQRSPSPALDKEEITRYKQAKRTHKQQPLPAEMALLPDRVAELERQMQQAQALLVATALGTIQAKGGGAAAASVRPTTAATSPAAATHAVLTSPSLQPRQQGTSLPLSVGDAVAAAAAHSQGTAPAAALGQPSLLASHGSGCNAAASAPAAGGANLSGSYGILPALVAALAKQSNAAANATVSIDPAAAAPPVPAAVGSGGGFTEPAIAALLGLTRGCGTAAAQAGQPGSSNSGKRAEQVAPLSSRLAVPLSHQWQQQQQPNQSHVLQQHPVQQPVQQNILPDHNQLLAAALSFLTGSQTVQQHQHQQQQVQVQPQGTSQPAAGQAQGYGGLSALLAALQQPTGTSTPAAPAVCSPATTGPTSRDLAVGNTGMSAALTQQSLASDAAVQNGVAAILAAVQAATAAATAAAAASGGADDAAGETQQGDWVGQVQFTIQVRITHAWVHELARRAEVGPDLASGMKVGGSGIVLV